MMGSGVGDFLYSSLFWSGSTTCCLFSVMFVYNLYGGVQFRREEHDDKASSVSMAAWGIGLLAYFPICCPGLLAMVAITLGWLERRRIYGDRSTLASSTPARMGTINGVMALLGYVLITVGYVMQMGMSF
jgi:hypothetical protein